VSNRTRHSTHILVNASTQYTCLNQQTLTLAIYFENMNQLDLNFFSHILHIGIIRRPENVKRGRGRPTLTWTEAVKRDLKEWNIDKELAVDRKGWKCAIHVPEP
jgi:hypothetical protein